jgi:hypothetical protein
VTFGVAYLGGGATTVAIDASDDGELSDASGLTFIPVAGPWVVLGTIEPNEGYMAGLVIQGVLELAGLGMLITGATVTREEERPGFGVRSREEPAPRVWLSPSIPGAGYAGGVSLNAAW